ncbi:O-antigen ligase family protein [Vibrio maerlii]|uniref:O-antigen ligase family protein n=1 Tax=Vibrio maerlii TaxID=2231648 RepID=UPI000E3D04D2|nr:O-antigen ligase family protein [Vibrio maerlii]
MQSNLLLESEEHYISRLVTRVAPWCLALFFNPYSVSIAGIKATDVISLVALGLAIIATVNGHIRTLAHGNLALICLFALYVFLNALLTTSRLSYAIVDAIQWVSIIAMLAIFHAYRCFNNTKVIQQFIYLLLLVALMTAAWHIAHGYDGFKYLGATKFSFGLLCTLTYIYRKEVKFAHWILAVGCALLIFSLERKAMLGFLCVIAADLLYVKQFNHNNKVSNSRFTPILGLLIFALCSACMVVVYFGVDHFLYTAEFAPLDIAFADQSSARWVSNLHRKLLLANGIDIFLQHPWFGVGAKMLPSYMESYFTYSELAIYSHNFLLDTSIEYGLVGIGLLGLAYTKFFIQSASLISLNRHALLLGIYALVMVFFVAVNTTVILIFLLPLVMSRTH